MEEVRELELVAISSNFDKTGRDCFNFFSRSGENTEIEDTGTRESLWNSIFRNTYSESEKNVKYYEFDQNHRPIRKIKLYYADDGNMHGMALYDFNRRVIHKIGAIEDNVKVIRFHKHERIIGINGTLRTDNRPWFEQFQFITINTKK